MQISIPVKILHALAWWGTRRIEEMIEPKLIGAGLEAAPFLFACA
jgi:hypothetical protein